MVAVALTMGAFLAVAVIVGIVALAPNAVLGARSLSLRGWWKSSETERLVQENKRLAQSVTELSEALHRSQRAERQGMALPPDTEPRTIGTVLGFGFGSGYGTLYVQTRSGAARHGDVVLTGDHTLVGMVESAAGTVAVVKTLFHPDLKIAADITPGSGRGLVSVTPRGMVMDFLPESFSLGTTTAFAETSGQDGLFRRGLLIGTVTEVSASQHIPLKQALVQPAFSVADLDAVMIIHNSLSP
jgi:cell shape-determining protein MreC